MDKIGNIGTFNYLHEMQAVLMTMKWEGEEPIIHKATQNPKKNGLKIESVKGRDGLRRLLLSTIGEECSRDIVIQKAVSHGYMIENIEEVLGNSVRVPEIRSLILLLLHPGDIGSQNKRHVHRIRVSV